MSSHLRAGLSIAAVAGCVSAGTGSELREIERSVAAPPPEAPAAPAGVRPGGPEDEAELSREARLSTILRVALARNPEIREAQERTRASLERVRAAARLPDLELKYEQWAVPLSRPLALDQAQMLMVGLQQSFPAPGSLSARERMALGDAHVLLLAQRERELDVAARARRAYWDLYQAEAEWHVHAEMVDLTTRMTEIARANYQAGRATQQDVLRLVVQLSRHHNDLATVEPMRQSARAMLNALMARPADAPIGPVPEIQPRVLELRADDLRRRLDQRRPALIAARRAVERGEATLDEARSRARWPSFMVGANYMAMPTQDSPHAWGAMVSMNLPWLNPRHGDEVRESEQALGADRDALDAVGYAARYELEEARARYDAARESFSILDRDLVRQARQSFESAQAGFSAGRMDAVGLMDALRTYLEVRLDRARAAARLESALADLERAVGGGPEPEVAATVERCP
jgi:outer membrane protein, heavy metal efflux system